MLKDMKKFKKLISIIVIILLVAYALIVYLPHEHKCSHSDCVICDIIDFSRNILTGALLLAIAQFLPKIIFILPVAQERILLFNEGTLVGLKVKLSD